MKTFCVNKHEISSIFMTMRIFLLFNTISVSCTKCAFGRSHSIYFLDRYRTISVEMEESTFFYNFKYESGTSLCFLTSWLLDVKKMIFLISIKKHWFHFILKTDIIDVLLFNLWSLYSQGKIFGPIHIGNQWKRHS